MSRRGFVWRFETTRRLLYNAGMSPIRPALVLPLCVSLGLHIAMGWSVAHHWSSASSQDPQTIQISYAEPPKVSAAPISPMTSKKAPSVAKKKLRGIPVPRLSEKTLSAPASEPSNFEKNLEEKLKQQQHILAKLSAMPPKNSAEILADPKKGKIFVEYFTEVRRKIQETLSERYAHRYSVRGGVAIGFVLNARGFLEKVAVLTKGTDGDARLQELAVQCLRESAPFGAFPSELGSDRIAFNVTLFFVDR